MIVRATFAINTERTLVICLQHDNELRQGQELRQGSGMRGVCMTCDLLLPAVTMRRVVSSSELRC